MTISLIGILIMLIVACIVVYCARLLISAFQVPQPFATLIYVVIVLIVLLIFLQYVGLAPWGSVKIR